MLVLFYPKNNYVFNLLIFVLRSNERSEIDEICGQTGDRFMRRVNDDGNLIYLGWNNTNT